MMENTLTLEDAESLMRLTESESSFLYAGISDFLGICPMPGCSTPPPELVEEKLMELLGSTRNNFQSAQPVLDSPAALSCPGRVCSSHLQAHSWSAVPEYTTLVAAPYNTEPHPPRSTQTPCSGAATPFMEQGVQHFILPAAMYVQPGAYRQGPSTYIPPVQIPARFEPCQPHNAQRKRKRRGEQEDDDQYVKKPPNAFMLYMKEQRAALKHRVGSSGAAGMHALLGKRWKNLSEEEQSKYYEQAEEAKRLHALQHPEWSARDNYGQKRIVRRDRRNASARPKAAASVSVSASTEDTQPAKRPRRASDNVPVPV